MRTLQEREVRPVGSTRTRKVHCRVVAASNRDLHSEASSGFFRADLYYRLAVFPIEVPPLRERSADVLPLAEHFLAHHGAREAKPGCRLSRAAQHLLLGHAWPGNVRELENEMQRALALAEPEEILTPRHLSSALRGPSDTVSPRIESGETLHAALARVEALMIRQALERNGGHRSATARELGVTREGLYKKMQRLSIE